MELKQCTYDVSRRSRAAGGGERAVRVEGEAGFGCALKYFTAILLKSMAAVQARGSCIHRISLCCTT